MNTLTHRILYSLFTERPNQNWVFSPASYLEAMASLSLCLKGKSLDELTALAPDLAAPQTTGLDTYNALFCASEYTPVLVQSVMEALAARGSEFKTFDGPEVVDEVNRLVREKTHGKIDELVSPEDLTPFTKLILLNCVYFKRDWLYPFKEDYDARPFHGATVETQVRFLSKQKGWRYYEDEKVDIVELPYKDSDVACYLMVPRAGLFSLFSDLGALMEKAGQVKHALQCHVVVPAFRTEATFKGLGDNTRAAGVVNAFEHTKDWSIIDFSRLDPATLMWIEKIVQKAYLDFTEKGTEAAAATAAFIAISGCMMPLVPPPTKLIRADKPFMYVLANRSEPTKPLFVGVVNDVSSSGPKPEIDWGFKPISL